MGGDLEKTNAVVAAFTVTGLVALLCLELVLTLVFMVTTTLGDSQNMQIAHSQWQVQQPLATSSHLSKNRPKLCSSSHVPIVNNCKMF